MKVDITKRQLEAIEVIAESLDSMIGSSEEILNGSDFDTDIKKELVIIKRFFTKNGYELNIT